MGGTIKLVATDLDGTLLDPSSCIPTRTRAALCAARRAGIAVVPVTGRPPQALWPVVDGAELGPLGVCSNGAVLVDIDAHELLEVELIAAEVAVRLVADLRRVVPGIILASDSLDGFYHESGFFDPPMGWTERVTTVPDILSTTVAGCVKLIARRPGWSAPELITALATDMAEEAHVTTSGLDWVDIGALGITKAYAIERVCDRLGVSVADVVAVGDNHNDLSVLAWAGTAMAPANAIPAVLAVVDRVLPANTEEGVAVLLEELVATRWSRPDCVTPRPQPPASGLRRSGPGGPVGGPTPTARHRRPPRSGSG
ncbi:MAG TPA: HAD family hydrolase [Acidimicrobiales bacterium]|nr:HAD family hydrolase [Acidimicrobiales bacterium]